MTGAVPPDDDVSGRQHERTSLAWIRTALTSVAVGLFMVRVTDPGVERWLVIVATTLGVLGVLAVARERTRRLRHEWTPRAWSTPGSAIVVASLLLLDASGLLLAF
jgi:uncharacterized membrane protein YidH (DUF202 family)